MTTTNTNTITKKYTMNFFSPDANSNKVWIGEAYSDGTFLTRFGRVRDAANLQTCTKKLSSAAAAEATLEQKRNEKLRKGYRDSLVLGDRTQTVIVSNKPQDLSSIAAAQIVGAADDSTTAALIKYLAEVNIHNITHTTSIKYNAANATFTTPLGVLTPDAIRQARNLLGDIQSANSGKSNYTARRPDLIREYFQLVPKDFGMRIPNSWQLLDKQAKIIEQNNILDALEAALSTAAAPAATTEAEKLFECRLSVVPDNTDEGRATLRKIRKLYASTVNANHQSAKLKLTRVYEVEISGMKSRFDAASKKLGNVRDDLWHGTKASNLLSILKNGLIIPPASSAHCTGRMFGNGIYTSLQSTKALNYATNYWNGSGARNQRTFMFLCQVALGKMHQPKMRTGSFQKAGTNSTWINPGTCNVMNQEAIVYDASQINLQYLCEFEAA